MMDIDNLYDMRILKKDYIPHIRYYYYRMFDQPYDMAPHHHSQVEMMYIEQGKCVIHIEGRSYPLGRNEFILINGGVSHGMQVEGGQSCRILNIEYAFIPDDSQFFSLRELMGKLDRIPLIFRIGKPCFVLRDTEEVYTTLKKMIYQLDTGGSYSQSLLNLLFWQLILGISKLLEEGEEQPSSSYGPYYIRKALGYINSNYYRDINVDDMAGELNLNRSYFHRLFKELVGSTPVEYLNNTRMERARVLLTRTDLSIMEVSKNVGIQSQQYFAYLFKRHFGISPGSYRKQYQINELR